MISKFIEHENDLSQFASLCGQKLNLVYPLAFLQKSRVRAFYHNGKMVGGYIINQSGSFRVINSLSDDVRRTCPWTTDQILNQTYELTGLWLDRSVQNLWHNFFFWVTLYLDMITTRKKYLVYAYDLDKKYLQKLYSVMDPDVIYRGVTAIQEGMDKECLESVEIASVNKIRFALFYKWDFFVKKLLIPRKLTKYYGITLSMRLKTLWS